MSPFMQKDTLRRDIRLYMNQHILGERPNLIKSLRRSLEITLSKAPLMSRNKHIVNWQRTKPVKISVVRISRLSWQDFLFLKPNWVKGRRSLDSLHQSKRFKINFSRDFRKQEVREMGLNLPGTVLDIRKTKDWDQDSGKRPSSKRPLRIERRKSG